MEPLLNTDDGQNALDAFKERLTLYGKSVTIRRNTGWTGGSVADGISATPSYTDIRTMAIVAAVSPREVFLSNGVLQQGDIKTSTLLEVKDSVEATGTQTKQEADLMVYESREWKMQGKPFRVMFGGGRVFTDSTWRRV